MQWKLVFCGACCARCWTVCAVGAVASFNCRIRRACGVHCMHFAVHMILRFAVSSYVEAAKPQAGGAASNLSQLITLLNSCQLKNMPAKHDSMSLYLHLRAQCSPAAHGRDTQHRLDVARIVEHEANGRVSLTVSRFTLQQLYSIRV